MVPNTTPTPLVGPAKPKHPSLRRGWDWLLPNVSIWHAWAHLVTPIDDLEAPALATRCLDYESATPLLGKYLEVIWYRLPAILLVGANHYTATELEVREVLAELKGLAAPGKEFQLVRRFLEVIESGNYTGRFKVPIPYVPAPMPPEPESPYKQVDFAHMVTTLDPLRNAFDDSLQKPLELDAEETWGRLLFSAMLYGGLTTTKDLLAISDAIASPERDPDCRWLMLEAVRKAEEEDIAPPRRWILDPLTRLLLARSLHEKLPDMPQLSRVNSRQVMRLLGAYAKCAGFADLLPKNFRDLASAVVTNLSEYLPPWLVAYSTSPEISPE